MPVPRVCLSHKCFFLGGVLFSGTIGRRTLESANVRERAERQLLNMAGYFPIRRYNSVLSKRMYLVCYWCVLVFA